MKKFVSMLIVLSMLLTLALPAFADGQATEEKAPFRKVVANLSDINAISKAGLKPSTEKTKSGSFIALLEGDALKKNTTIPVNTSDFSDAECIEFYAYTPSATATAFGLTLISDNPDTQAIDHYYALVACNFTGWKHISVKMSTLRTSGTPKGLDAIDNIMIMPGYSNSLVDPVAKIYIDNIEISDKQSEDANVEEEGVKYEPYVLYTAEEGLRPPTVRPGGEVVEKDGKLGFKMGPGFEAFDAISEIRIPITPEMHMERYTEVVMEVYSAKSNIIPFNVRLYGKDNPETPRNDFFHSSWKTNWEGEWNVIRIPYAGGSEGRGDLRTSSDPIFEPFEANRLTLSTPYTTNFLPDTEVYIHKIYFDGQHADTIPNPTGEILLEDNYDPEKMTDYVAKVKEKHPDRHHPRIYVNDEVLERIKKYKDTDTFMKKAYQFVEETANKFLTEEPEPPYHMNTAGTYHQFSRNIWDIAKYCGMMYLLTDDADKKAEYADRIWEEIVNMVESDKLWSSINTGYDCSQISHAVAVAYDWCYDYWTRDQKLYVRNAFMKHTFPFALRVRDGVGWMNSRNNMTVINSWGYMVTALTICDEPGYENICNELMNYIIKYLPINFMHQLEPDGGYSEGITYWRTSIYCYVSMTEGMMSAMGTDAGLMDHPAFRKTCYFPFAMTGAQYTFNHSDASKTALRAGDAMYFVLDKRYNIPQLPAYRLATYDLYEGGVNIDDLLWYDPEHISQIDWHQGLPKDYFFGGLEPTAIMRSNYEPDCNYLGTKGGNSNSGHDQYDSGTFVLDALGVRWIEDTGAGLYGITSLAHDYYYYKRPEAHNCIVFDPERGWIEGGGQTVATSTIDTICPIIDSGSSNGAGFTVYDLWPAYKETTTSYKRGFALANNRTQFIVRDEFETTEPFEFYSYFHTLKDNEITINPDGKSLTMKTKNGQLCKVNFITDIPSFEIGVMEAEKHPASPVIPPNEGHVPDRDYSTFHKFYLHAENVKKANITVVFTPMLQDEAVVLPENLPLNQWDKYLENNTALTGISVDGVPLAEFDPGIGNYTYEAETIGTVTATAGDGIEVSVTQANAMGQAALIKATNKNTGKSFTYRVSFTKLSMPGISSGIEFDSVEAHHIPEPQNPPAHMTDGNLATRFAIDGYDGSAYFVIDLGDIRCLDQCSIAFYNGQSRKNKFKLEISEDKENWITLFDGFTTGTTDQLTGYDFEPTWGRYFRFTGYGCYSGDEETQASKWNSISEFALRERGVDFADTSGHWAQAEILFARNYNLVNGVGANMYMPENPVTRAEFIAMMVRACGFNAAAYEEGTFSDVRADDWFANNVMTAVDEKIIPSEMIADGSFKPNQKLTREEMSAIAVLAYSSSARREAISAGITSMFNDLSDGPYLTYIDKAIGLRFVNGMSQNTFAPKANITRAQAATILRRVFLKIYNVNN